MSAHIGFANPHQEGWDVFIDGFLRGHVFADDSEGPARKWRAAVTLPGTHGSATWAHGIGPTRKAAVEAAMIEGGIA